MMHTFNSNNKWILQHLLLKIKTQANIAIIQLALSIWLYLLKLLMKNLKDKGKINMKWILKLSTHRASIIIDLRFIVIIQILVQNIQDYLCLEVMNLILLLDNPRWASKIVQPLEQMIKLLDLSWIETLKKLL